MELNGFGWFILITVLAATLLDVLASLLNLRKLGDEPPCDLEDLYDQDRYRKSQAYTRARTSLSVSATLLGLLLLLAFWLAGGFAIVDSWTRLVPVHPVGQGFLFIALLGIAQGLFMVPFDLYGTFVIEERFGFNRTTLRTWLLDRVKGTLVAGVIGTPLLVAVLALFQYAGASAWWICWLVMGVSSFLLQLIIPTWIMPLFSRFDPLPEGELRDALESYAAKVGFPLRDVTVMDGSRRTAKANAFFTGIGKNRRVALFDTLVERYETKELVAVLAHEVGHFKLRHIPIGLLLGQFELGLMFGLLALFLPAEGLYDAFGVVDPTVATGLVFFGLLMVPLNQLIGLAGLWLSRRFEFQADRFAVSTTGDPEALVSGLKRLSSESLANLTPHPLQVVTSYSHPPLAQRIASIRSG